jgi:glycine/D-amino acid oxidase-like deaminating enzyme
MEKYDKIIIGAGIYGLYSALFCAERGGAKSNRA